jgi:hypothetical protein
MNTKQRVSAQRGRASCRFGCQRVGCDRISLPRNPPRTEDRDQQLRYPGNVGLVWHVHRDRHHASLFSHRDVIRKAGATASGAGSIGRDDAAAVRLSMVALPVSTHSALRPAIDVFDPDAAPRRPQALVRLPDTAHESAGCFRDCIEPIVFGPKADQHSGGVAVAGDHDLLVLATPANRRDRL